MSITLDLSARQRLHDLHDRLTDAFWQNHPIEELLRQHSDAMDEIVGDLYEQHIGRQTAKIALYAVGGYGRQELHPGSDIDLLIVADAPARLRQPIEDFLRSAFDLNIEVGHAVRDVKACRSESKNDITVATAMFERRFLYGDAKLAARLDKAMDSPRVWPPEEFFAAKLKEQRERHDHYDNTEYNLEPNVKTSPGGLRDIHTALWICKRQYGTTDPQKLTELGVLTELECKWLVEGRRFIWWVRFGLHLVAGRKEDRLQFTYQRDLAERLGFVDTDAQRGVERFMHHYYRHVLLLSEVNDVLIQHFNETIVGQSRRRRRADEPQPITEHFQLVNNYIEARDPQLFAKKPSALLEIFVVMANRRDIAGVRLDTIRHIRDALDSIDEDFRNNPAHTSLFMQLLKAPYTLVSQLTRMRRYGILGRYIPEYGRVIGQMQHDLFHIYTVDAHTMMVIQNMRRFRYRASRKEHPIAHHSVKTVPKIELLYISGLYHDIGKGRGGDHSSLGAVDAREFCQRHNLSEADTNLVCWLVERHLYMSTVSQREDIYDPDVVQKFAAEVKSEMRLDYLYALTVADIKATNPTLWNSWRATLMRHLYQECRKLLRNGLESAADKAETISAYQERAMERMFTQDPELSSAAVIDLWQQLGDDFFLRHSPPQIARFTQELLISLEDLPSVSIHDTVGDHPGEGATNIYIYAPDQPQLFAKTVVALSGFELSVVEAQVHTSANGMCFDVYTVLNEDGQALPRDSEMRSKIVRRLRTALSPEAPIGRMSKRRLARQLRELTSAAEVDLRTDDPQAGSILTIIATDRPGLLATIATIFVDLELKLQSAKIATLGERVEDTFVVLDANDQAITDAETAYTLQETVRQRIDAALRS